MKIGRVRPVNPEEVRTGMGGTSALFVVLIIVSATFPSLVRNLLAIFNTRSIFFNNKNFLITLVVDFVMIILPVECMKTVLHEQALYFFLFTCCVITVLLVYGVATGGNTETQRKPLPFLLLPMSNTPFISYFRAYTNIFTGFAILAVDFRIYPIYFMKSRVYGTALMDTGLGFYVMSNAIVSPEARNRVSFKSTKSAMNKATVDTIPLFILGFARFFVTGMADYHVPVQEYGFHWNFFFTLAVVKLGSAMLFCMTPRRFQFLLGPVIIVMYQYLLSTTFLHDFVLFGFEGNGARRGLIESNREGIVSSIGFLAIYFVGVQIGKLLLKKRQIIAHYVKTTTIVGCVCGSSWLLMNLTAVYVERPSRKYANMSYTFFIIGVTTTLMLQGLVFDIILTYFKHKLTPFEGHYSNKDTTCPLLLAVNYNGLLFFLIANLMTGAINLLTDTEQYTVTQAFVILNIYMLTVSAVLLHFYRTKFVFKTLLFSGKHCSGKDHDVKIGPENRGKVQLQRKARPKTRLSDAVAKVV